MTHFFKTCTLAFALALSACGGAEPGDFFEDESADGGDELGSIEQGYAAPVTPSFQFGTQTATTRMRCNKTSSGQVCNVIDHKNIYFCSDSPAFSGGLAGLPAYTAFSTAASQLQSTLSTWVIAQGEYELFQDKCMSTVAHPIALQVFGGAVGSSGPVSNDTKDYVSWSYGPVTGLTEGAGVVGQYQKFFGCNITLDTVDVDAKYSGTARAKLYNQLAKQAIVGCFGAGRRDFGFNVSFATSKRIFSGTSDFTLTPGEQCAINNYDTTNNGFFSNSGSSSTCPND